MLSRSRFASSRFTLRAAIGLMSFIVVLFLALLLVTISREWSDARDRVNTRALAGSQVVGTNAVWLAELSRQALARVDEALGSDITTNAPRAAILIEDAVEDLPGNVAAYVVDAQGRTVFATDPGATAIDIRDRSYFNEPAEGADWYLSELMISRINNEQIFVFSKRLERNREFAGVAVLSFDVRMMRDTWAALDLDENSAVALVRGDGKLIAHYPFAEGPLDLSGSELFTTHLERSGSGSYETTSPVDGIEQLVGYQTVPGANMIALTAIDLDGALSQSRRIILTMLFLALPAMLALLLALWAIASLIRRDQVTKKELLATIDHNQMLVRDTHHRVKNNLQAIMSMVRMHALPPDLKMDLQARISAMSAVHEHLYRLDRFAEVDASRLVPDIVDSLVAGGNDDVKVEYDIDKLIIDHDHATSLALVVSELVTNSLKYAFPHGRGGSIWIAMKCREEDGVSLSVVDDGVGFEQGEVEEGLGTRLIRAMLRPLGGEAHYTIDGGTRFATMLSSECFIKPAELRERMQTRNR